MKRICDRGIPRYLRGAVAAYLNSRYIQFETAEGEGRRRVFCGVPQGSVLGPLLWNIFYDGVLSLRLPRGCSTIGYADDVLVVVTAPDREALDCKIQHSMRLVGDWMASSGLEIAPEKTVVFSANRKWLGPPLLVPVGGQMVPPSDSVKYLGVTFDRSQNFKVHIEKVTSKATRLMYALARLMPNIGGPGQRASALYYQVMESVLLYTVTPSGGAL